MLAAVESQIGNLQQPWRQLSHTAPHALQRAQTKACRYADASLIDGERGIGNGLSELAGDAERSVMGGLGQYDGEFLAADACHPVYPCPQSLLQARPELLQDLIAARVAECLVYLSEMIDVAQDDRQRMLVGGCPLDFARKVAAEEAATRCTCKLVGRGKSSGLLQSGAEPRPELPASPRGADARVALPIGCTSSHAFVGPGRESRFALGTFIHLRDIDDERCPRGGLGAQSANQLRTVRE